MSIMTVGHPRWLEFLERQASETTTRGCDGLSHARRILPQMGFSLEEVAASLEYFKQHGGLCDCEVVMNVPDSARAETDVPAAQAAARALETEGEGE